MVRFRELFFIYSIVSVVALLILVLFGHIYIVPNNVDLMREYLTIVVGTTASFGGISFAVMFLTAQTRPLGAQASVVVSLYKSKEFAVLSFFLFTGVIGIIVIWPWLENVQSIQWLYIISQSLIIICICSILFIIPAMLLQVENLDSIVVAQKLIKFIKQSSINQYELSRVEVANLSCYEFQIQIQSHSTNYNRFDPLQPFHEIVESSIKRNNRLELGKLHKILLSLIVKFHNKFNLSIVYSHILPTYYRSMRLRKIVNQLKLTVHVLHYCIRHAARLRRSWGLDIGRHSLIFCLSNLILQLNELDTNDAEINLILAAIWEISIEYEQVLPFGRDEPINVLFQVANVLSLSGRHALAERVGNILGGLTVRTSQITADRINIDLVQQLPNDVLNHYHNAVRRASVAPLSWSPFSDKTNPWENSSYLR